MGGNKIGWSVLCIGLEGLAPPFLPLANPHTTQCSPQAMHGWDHAVMYDMYTWDSLREVAASNDLDLGDVLQVIWGIIGVYSFGVLLVDRLVHGIDRMWVLFDQKHTTHTHPQPHYKRCATRRASRCRSASGAI